VWKEIEDDNEGKARLTLLSEVKVMCKKLKCVRLCLVLFEIKTTCLL
jgi:hypothetical protein